MWQLPPGITPDEILYYLRKSRTDDPTLTVEEVLEKHEQMLDDWVERNMPDMGKVPESNRHREVVSGETIQSRPAFQELLRRIEAPKLKAVLIKEVSRLGRPDLEEIGRIVKLFRYTNTLVITLDDIYDLREERDRELFERALMRGNEYLEYQKKILNAGRMHSAAGGNYIGQSPPWGYNKIRVKEGKTYCHTLEPDPEQAPIVVQIFEWYSQGIGTTTIADRLNAMHVPAPRGPEWYANSINMMLRNEHYLGKIVWNKRKAVREVEDGQVVVRNPLAEEYLIYPGKHPAIISQELWDRSQAVRGRVSRKRKNTKPYNPLTGLVYCAKCGAVVVARPYRDKEGNELSRPRLLCSKQKRCGTASAALDDVVQIIADALREAIADFEIRIDAGTDDSHEIHVAMVARLEKRMEELRELEIAQWDEKTKGGMPQHVFDRLNSQVLREIDEVQEALCAAKDSIPEPVNLQERRTSFQKALEALQDPEAPILEKNMLLKACIDRIEFHRERIGHSGRPKGGEGAPIQLDITLEI
jgi:DNA invertase Pin-like site-specific DNA recombinase